MYVSFIIMNSIKNSYEHTNIDTKVMMMWQRLLQGNDKSINILERKSQTILYGCICIRILLTII